MIERRYDPAVAATAARVSIDRAGRVMPVLPVVLPMHVVHDDADAVLRHLIHSRFFRVRLVSS